MADDNLTAAEQQLQNTAQSMEGLGKCYDWSVPGICQYSNDPKNPVTITTNKGKVPVTILCAPMSANCTIPTGSCYGVLPCKDKDLKSSISGSCWCTSTIKGSIDQQLDDCNSSADKWQCAIYNVG